MKDQKELSLMNFRIFFLSFMGSGLIPVMPGTMGSLATIPFLYLLGYFKVSIYWVILLSVFLTLVGTYLTEDFQKEHKIHDPSWIVIDEVIGMLITWCFWPSFLWRDLFILFGLFRFFDIIKFWPASFFDKKVKHGIGVMLDDALSAIYAGFCYYLIQKFLLT